MRKSTLTFIVTIILFGSCKKSSETIGNITITSLPIPVATPVTGSVAGSVVDENNNPVANAQVSVSNTVYTTDSKGFFNTGNIALDKYISTVTVNKTGYFKATRSFSANATKNYVNIKLIPKTLAGTFASSSSGIISLSNSSQILFAANSINIKSSGAAYTGTVNVYASYIDPTGSDIATRVPGNFIGEDATQIYYLQSAGMIAVELESSTGESLQLASGKPATIKLAIPATVQANAQATIDTWSLNDKGIWIKEGTATKNGAFYEMQVSHFSFWNCDAPTKTVYLTLNIKDQNNKNIPNALVQLKITDNKSWGTSYGVTDSLGNVSGMVPGNEALQLNLLSNSYICTNALFTQNIGPFTSNTSLNIAATLQPQQSLSITGKVNNCFGSAVTKGSVIISADSHAYYTTVVNGAFDLNMIHCSSLPITINITTIDSAGQQQSTNSYTATQNTLDAGTISSCGTSTIQFINYTVDGINYLINSATTGTNFYGYNQSSITRIYGRENNAKNITVNITGAGVGTFKATIDSLNTTFQYPTAEANASSTISTYGVAGQYIEGTFDIPFHTYGSTVVHSCTGTFRVRRSF